MADEHPAYCLLIEAYRQWRTKAASTAPVSKEGARRALRAEESLTGRFGASEAQEKTRYWHLRGKSVRKPKNPNRRVRQARLFAHPGLSRVATLSKIATKACMASYLPGCAPAPWAISGGWNHAPLTCAQSGGMTDADFHAHYSVFNRIADEIAH